MNIFILDNDIGKCARAHCDKHVMKMILESAQILCTAANIRGFETPYRPTHRRHPCVLWAAESLANFRWLVRLGLALEKEYRYRWGEERSHRSGEVIHEMAGIKFEDIGPTEFAQAVPEWFRIQGDAVSAYRNYYIEEKSSFAKWTRRHPPKWFFRDELELASNPTGNGGKSK